MASHGDFVNRRLNIINHELLNDPAMRARCGIVCEAYDPELLAHFDAYLSDRPYPQFYHPMSPFAALARFDHPLKAHRMVLRHVGAHDQDGLRVEEIARRGGRASTAE